MKKTNLALTALAVAMLLVPALAAAGQQPVFDKKTPRNPNDIIYGGRGVTQKSGIACVASLIIPGVGQLINENKPGKALVHFVLGIPVYLAGVIGPVAFIGGLWHVWSGWDALIDRRGGYVDGYVGNPGELMDASLGRISPYC